MGVQNWRPSITMDDWMRDIEKRVMHQERRPSVLPAYEIVGPGLSTYAQRVNDWNSGGPVVNGFFYSDANQVVNSPDNTQNWIGIVEANPFGQGVQRVWEYIEGDPVEPCPGPETWIRSFITNDDGTRTYSDWTQESGGGTGGAPTGPAGGELTGTYPNPQIAGQDFYFASALAVWPCPHNLGKLYVQVFTVDASNQEMYGDVVHVNPDLVEIHWYSPTSGTARISA